MSFIQIIEMTTTRPDQVEALVAEWWTATEGRHTIQRSTFTGARDDPDAYVQIVEFPSHEDALANSGLPETSALAERLAILSDAPLRFRNLDVRGTEDG